MNCEKTKELLSLYIDGILDENERKFVETHIEQCAKCRAEYHKLIATLNILNELEELEPPAILKKNVMKSLTKQNSQSKFIIRRNWIAWGATAAVVIIMVGSIAVSNLTDFRGLENMVKNDDAQTGRVAMDIASLEPEKANGPGEEEIGVFNINGYADDNSLRQGAEGVYSLTEYSLELTSYDKQKTLEEISLLLNDAVSFMLQDNLIVVGWLDEFNGESMAAIKEHGDVTRDYLLEEDMLVEMEELELRKQNLLAEIEEDEDTVDRIRQIELATITWQIERLKELHPANIVFYEIYIR